VLCESEKGLLLLLINSKTFAIEKITEKKKSVGIGIGIKDDFEVCRMEKSWVEWETFKAKNAIPADSILEASFPESDGIAQPRRR
jgi:hypothetical protein